MKPTISVSVVFPSGGLRLSAMLGGQLVSRTYSGYSRKQAVSMFREYLSTLF